MRLTATTRRRDVYATLHKKKERRSGEIRFGVLVRFTIFMDQPKWSGQVRNNFFKITI